MIISLLTFIFISVALLFISKGLIKLSKWLSGVGQTASDIIEIHKAKTHKQILQHNKIVEENLQSITGEKSYAAYRQSVRREIEELIDEVSSNPHA